LYLFYPSRKYKLLCEDLPARAFSIDINNSLINSFYYINNKAWEKKMWLTILVVTDLLMDAMAGIADQVNVRVLDILRASRFSDLFLTLILTGSFSTAVTVLFIGCILPAAKSGS
jgi:hypothetical protein